jgi:hypothetical protein
MGKRRIVILAAIAAVVALALSGCGPTGPSFNLTDITGTGGAGAWNYVSGLAEVSGDEYHIELYAVATNGGVDPWTVGAYDGPENSILLTAPATEDPIELKLLGDGAQTVTYNYDGTDNIISDGWVQLTVSPPNVTVQMDVWTSDYSFNGTTVVPLAP